MRTKCAECQTHATAESSTIVHSDILVACDLMGSPRTSASLRKPGERVVLGVRLTGDQRCSVTVWGCGSVQNRKDRQ